MRLRVDVLAAEPAEVASRQRRGAAGVDALPFLTRVVTGHAATLRRPGSNLQAAGVTPLVAEGGGQSFSGTTMAPVGQALKQRPQRMHSSAQIW